MSFGPWIDGYLQVGSTDLSDHVREMSLDMSVAELPDHCHGDTVAKVCAGLEKWMLAATFLQDFGETQVDATLKPLCTVGTPPFFLVIGGSMDTPTEESPWYKGAGILIDYRPLGGEHGDNLVALATFQVAGTMQRITDINQDSRIRPLDHSGRVRPVRHTSLRLPFIYSGGLL